MQASSHSRSMNQPRASVLLEAAAQDCPKSYLARAILNGSSLRPSSERSTPSGDTTLRD